MFRIKRARSVIHSVAHHGVSALSWLHPRLGEECKTQGFKEIEFDLIEGNITSNAFTPSQETINAFSALKETFYKLAIGENISISDLYSTLIIFGFERGRWPSYCVITLSTVEGKKISVKVDEFGRKYGPLSKYGAHYS